MTGPKGITFKIRISRSGRKKNLAPIKLFYFIGLPLALIPLTLFLLSFYTPWITFKKLDPALGFQVPSLYLHKDLFSTSNLEKALKDNQAAFINALTAKEPSPDSSLPSARLWVSKNTMEKLDHDILLYEFNLVKKKTRLEARYEDQKGLFFPVTFGLRGTMRQHHLIWKPSLRLKFPKYSFPDGNRNKVLIAPEDGIGFRNWLSSELARHWNILNYDENFIRLFINNKYMGLYNSLNRLDESLLIQNNLLPGLFFRLELKSNVENWTDHNAWVGIKATPEFVKDRIRKAITASERIIGRKMVRGGINKFDLPLVFCPGTPKIVVESWLKKGKVEPYLPGWPGEPSWPCWSRPSSADHLTLNEFVDQETFSKYLAILTHAGETHVDDRHNNAFWLDPVSGKLKPIPEDITGYDFPTKMESQARRSIIKSQGAFVMAWQKNPENFALYIDRLNELLNTFGSAAYLEKLLRKKWLEVRPSVVSDLNMSEYHPGGRILLPLNKSDANLARLIEFIHKRNRWLKEELSSDTISIVDIQEDSFKVIIQGFSGANVYTVSGPERKLSMSSMTLLPSVSMRIDKIQATRKPILPAAYAFYELSGKPSDYHFEHRLTGQTLNFTPPPAHIDILRAIAGINILDFPELITTPVTIGPGQVIFNETREFNVGQSVTIKAGTKLKLGPGVSLVFRGPLRVEGTLDRPVTVRPINPEKPFGVMALLGEHTKESHIIHLDIEGGSIHRRYNLEFSGMFSVHDCPGIEIHNSRFGKNFIGDDAVHIMRSTAWVYNSVFEDALFDALDWDKVEGEVSNSLFVNPGNDGLDLSMGNARIISSKFSACGDKCISAGEGARASVTDSYFQNCNIGVAVKDRSRIQLDDSLFSNCRIGYNSYRKKWRWEKGGEGVIKNTRFLNSREADIAGDKHSKVSISKAGPDNILSKGRIHIESFRNY